MEINKKLYQVEVPKIEDVYYQLNKHEILDYHEMKFIWKPRNGEKYQKLYFDDILHNLQQFSISQAQIIEGMGKLKLINSFVFKVPFSSQKNTISLKYKETLWNKVKVKAGRKTKVKFPEFQYLQGTFLPLHLLTELSLCFQADHVPEEGIEVSCYLHAINSFSQEKIWDLMEFRYTMDNQHGSRIIHFKDQKMEFYSVKNFPKKGKKLTCNLYQKGIIPLVLSQEETILEIYPPSPEIVNIDDQDSDNDSDDSGNKNRSPKWKEICQKAPGFVKFREGISNPIQSLLGLLMISSTLPEDMVVTLKEKEACQKYLDENKIEYQEKKYYVEGKNHQERLQQATHLLSLQNVRTFENVMDLGAQKRKQISEFHTNQVQQKRRRLN